MHYQKMVHRRNSQLTIDDMTPAKALGTCFGGADKGARKSTWAELPNRPGHWHVTLDADYAAYLTRYFERNGERLGATCYSTKTISEENPRVIFKIVTDAPFTLVRRCMQAARYGTVAANYLHLKSQESARPSLKNLTQEKPADYDPGESWAR